MELVEQVTGSNLLNSLFILFEKIKPVFTQKLTTIPALVPTAKEITPTPNVCSLMAYSFLCQENPLRLKADI